MHQKQILICNHVKYKLLIYKTRDEMIYMVRHCIKREKRVPTSVAFDVDILARIEAVRGRVSRSSWVNNLADIELTKVEKKLGIV